MMKKFSLKIFGAAILASAVGAIAATDTAIAGYSSVRTHYAEAVHPLPTFRIESDGANYTGIPTSSGVAFTINFEINGQSYKIKKISTDYLHVKVKNPKTGKYAILDLTKYGPSVTFKAFNRPTGYTGLMSTQIIPTPVYENFFARKCNQLAEMLREQGMPDWKIFGKDRNLEVVVQIHPDVDWGRNTSGSVAPVSYHPERSDEVSLSVTCAKHDTSDQHGTFIHVSSANLMMMGPYKNPNVPRSCPLEVPFRVSLDGSPNAKVKYRLRTADNKVTKAYTTKLNSAGKIQETLQIPVPTPVVGNPYTNHDKGDFGEQQPGAPFPGQAQNTGGKSSKVSGFTGAKPSTSGLHKQSFRVEILEPFGSKKVASNYTGYIVKCKLNRPESSIGTFGDMKTQTKPNETVGKMPFLGGIPVRPSKEVIHLPSQQ